MIPPLCLTQTRAAHSDVASLKSKLALVKSSSLEFKDEMSSRLEEARLKVDGVLESRLRMEEAWAREKEDFVSREEEWKKRVEEGEKRATEWKDAESLMKAQILDLETNFDERMAEELEKKAKQVRLEEEETKRNAINEINLRNAHEIEVGIRCFVHFLSPTE